LYAGITMDKLGRTAKDLHYSRTSLDNPTGAGAGR
jgi:hypothetical protein